MFLQTCTHKKKTSFTTVPNAVSTWVPDLNLNKNLEYTSETPCKYFLHSKSSFKSLYTLNLLFLHIPEYNLPNEKILLLHALLLHNLFFYYEEKFPFNLGSKLNNMLLAFIFLMLQGEAD